MNIFSRKGYRFLKRKKIIRLFIILFTLFIINKFFLIDCIVDLFIKDNEIVCEYEQGNPNNLEIHFLDVGQSEAILLRQGGDTMLIDTSLPSYGKGVCEYLKEIGIKRIDTLILTHPHIDHIGGASKVIRSFEIGKIYISKIPISVHSIYHANIRRICFFKDIPIKYAKTGTGIPFGDCKVNFIAPNRDFKDLNNYSIGIKLTYGKVSTLLLGDAQAESEEAMIESDFNLNCDILKISHHGSITSSTEEFLDYVKPEYAILSVGSSNSYGHPTKTVINRLKERSIPVYRTDQSGTIIVTTNGKHIWFNKEAGDYEFRKKKESALNLFFKVSLK